MFLFYHIYDKVKSRMIDVEKFFDEYKHGSALWCPVSCEGADLAKFADNVVSNGVSMVSVVPSAVATIWPWLEPFDVKIISRVYIDDKKVSEKHVSDITQVIKESFKYGAHGAQVFLPMAALAGLVDMTYWVKDDLFFDRDLIIGLNISEINPLDWNDVFENLRKIGANALMLVLPKDTGIKSDFVGKINAMLDAWHEDNQFDLHFMLGGNVSRIEQTLRLVESMQPELIKRLKFFVGY